MKLIRFAFTLIIILAGTLIAGAQSAATSPIRWRTAVRMTSPTEGTVTFKALVADGWHLYGLDLPDDGPRPTHFDLSESTGVTFTGVVTPARAPISVDDPMFGMTLTWWDSDVVFKVPFRLTGSGDAMIRAAISYMACNDVSCRPPKTERIATLVPAYAE